MLFIRLVQCSIFNVINILNRGFKEAEMDRVVALIDSALKLAVEIQVNSSNHFNTIMKSLRLPVDQNWSTSRLLW